MDIAKKIQSLVRWTTLIALGSLGQKIELNGHENEIWEVGRVMALEQWLSSYARVI